MGILRTLAHAFRNFQTGMIQVLFVYSKERPKGKGEEKVKFVVFFLKFTFSSALNTIIPLNRFYLM